MLYFINEDGTVGKADAEYRMNNEISVIKDIGYKNIVSIISGTFGDEFTGYHGPIFIDINGRIYSEAFKQKKFLEAKSKFFFARKSIEENNNIE